MSEDGLKKTAEARMKKVQETFEMAQKRRDALIAELQKIDAEIFRLQGEARALDALLKEEPDGKSDEQNSLVS